jgi:putative ABC transport system permease protein
MSIWEYITVAFENLRLNKMRSFLTIIGIVVGVAAVVTVVSIGEAGKSSVLSEISQYGDGFFVVYPNYAMMNAQNDISITIRDIDQIKKMDGISTISGLVTLTLEAKFDREKANFTVNAGSSDLFKQENVKLVAGRFYNEAENRAKQKVVVVESAFADKFYNGAANTINRKLIMDGKLYRIIGVYKKEASLLSFGGEQYSAYMPLNSVPAGLEGGRVDILQADTSLGDADKVAELIAEVKKLLAKRHNVEVRAYMSQTGAEAQAQISSVFNILQTVIGSIAGISLLVGGIGVMNIMLVSVTERTREIGIRKAIGATPGAIMGQFMIEAVILSFLGGLLGALLGLLASSIFALATGWPFLVSWWAILLAFFFSAAVGVFFGLYPANKASRLQPIEALRYE